MASGVSPHAEIAAAGALLAYVEATAKGAVPLLTPPRPELPGSTMAIDAATRSSLELARGAGGGRAGSLEAASIAPSPPAAAGCWRPTCRRR